LPSKSFLSCAQSRAALRDDLEAINRTARATADDVPGIDDKFRIPRIVRNKYANNPAVLAEWISASHTERAPRRAKAPEPAPATSGQ